MIYKHYPQYKDSGVEWIGAVPEGWGFGRIKLAIAESKNGVWGEEPDGINDIPCVRVADFDRASLRVTETIPTLRSVSGNERSGRVLQLGDLLLEKSGGGEKQPVGQVVLYTGTSPAVCSNFVARLKIADGHAAAFWNYVFAAGYSIGLNCRSIKQTSGIQNLDQEQYLNEQVAIPQYLEQVAIAATIDLECARIGALITKKTQFIELLREKRQALITHAVTKGLDPNVPMKDSGVEWIGDVPAHWKICALGRVASIATGGTPDRKISSYWNGTIPWIKTGEVNYEDISSAEESITDSGLLNSAAYVAKPGTILMAMYGMGVTRGRVATLKLPAAFNQACAGISCDKSVDGQYVYYSLIAAYTYVRDLANEASQANLSTEIIRKLNVATPPHNEQQGISRHIDQMLPRIDALITQTNRSIELLRERRAAFITAAVTGQIDLRDEATAQEAAAA